MSIEEDLKPTISDHIHSAISAITSVVPGGSDAFNWLVDKPINIRRDQWIVEMEKRLCYLELHGLKIDDLQSNEEFISAVLYASSIAIRNHSEEKRKALLNAITNIAFKTKINETKEKIFLNYIDSLTDWHLRILWYFENPKQRFIDANKKNTIFSSGAPSVVFYRFFDEQEISNELAKIIINDLHAKSLLAIDESGFNTIMGWESASGRHLTGLGREFFNFIKDIE